MSFVLRSIVPWGRSFEEYVAMFNLDDADLRSAILGCGDGPAGFNARMHRLGRRVVSCDPLYRFTHDEIRNAIELARPEVMQQVRENMGNFVWKTIRSPDELEQVRMGAMQEFLADFKAGRTDGRYVDASLPSLPFDDQAFDLCLCSHFLFLYDSLGPAFHLQSIREMARVAGEVRIYPLINTNCLQAGYFQDLLCQVRQVGLCADPERVSYDLWRNGVEMIRITRASR